MKRATKLLAPLLLIAAGCTSEPPAVSVDLDAVARALESQPASVTVPGESGYGPAADTLEGSPEKRVLTGDAADVAQQSLADIKESQEEAFGQLKARLIRIYSGELAVQEEALREAMLERYRAGLDEDFLLLRSKFEDLALAVGPKWRRIAWLAGFPDPDPHSTRVPLPGDFITERRYEMAKELREEINALEEEFGLEAEEILEDARLGLRADIADLEMDIAMRRQEAEAEADLQAREAAIRAFDAVDVRTLDLNRTLDAVQEAGIALPPAPPFPGLTLTEPARDDRLEQIRLREQAEVFAQINGWVLSDEGEDKTGEFLLWRAESKAAR